MKQQLLYLTNNGMTARTWQSGRLSGAVWFDNDVAGWEALAVHLAHFRDLPAYLLMDLYEEDFQHDRQPHVLGTSRKNMIARRLLQLYRDTPFRHASIQGREKTGRGDDRILFNALTNAALIKPWIDAIQKSQVPLAGLYSSALLSKTLHDRLQLGYEPLLLVTHQSAGLRQNFFQDGYLRFSRLIALPSNEADQVAEITVQEIAKTRLFLANSRLLQRGQPLNIFALDNQETLDRIVQSYAGAGDTTLVTISLEQAGQRLGTKQLVQDGLSDTLLLALLTRKTPASHYALAEQYRAYLLWQTRIILYIFSGATMAGCLLWSSANTLEAIDAYSQIGLRQDQLHQYEQRSGQIRASMPQTAVNPHDMKSVVDVHALLAQNASNPRQLLRQISIALERQGQLQLNELNWDVTDSPASADNPAPAPAPQPGALTSATLIGIPARPAETVLLSGAVLPFKNDYRSALQIVKQFCADLEQDPHINIAVLKQPLDTRPTVALTGIADDRHAANAEFSIRIVWKP